MRLETERLLLREWEDRDRAPLAAIMGDAHVRRFYPRTLTPEEASAEIDLARARSISNGFHFLAAELKATGELAGLIGLGRMPEVMQNAIPGRPEVEIGWLLRQTFWGHGLAPEGARACLEHAWNALGLAEVVAFTAAINLPSQRVMEKIGMVRDHASDFDHPKLPPDHRLRAHRLYRIYSPRS